MWQAMTGLPQIFRRWLLEGQITRASVIAPPPSMDNGEIVQPRGEERDFLAMLMMHPRSSSPRGGDLDLGTSPPSQCQGRDHVRLVIPPPHVSWYGHHHPLLHLVHT